MEIQQLADGLITSIQTIYANNADPDFDIMPLLAMARFNDDAPIMMPFMGEVDGDVIEHLVPKFIEAASPDIYALVNAGWIKNEANERIGELVMLTLETKKQQLSYMFKVTRGPLPVLEKPERMDSAMGRLTGFLHQPTRH